jgi:hypothetical protein
MNHPYLLRASLTLAFLPFAAAAPAEAATVPAYGAIRIANDGLGAVPTWTYDPALWDCSTRFDGQFTAPSAVTVTCSPHDGDGEPLFHCPLMVLTVRTSGPAARAGGAASCTTGIDTGVISGVNAAAAYGNLGVADQITCTAYVDALVLAPPYEVTCSEPGLPG